MQQIIEKLNEIQKYIEQQDDEIKKLKQSNLPIVEELLNHLGKDNVDSSKIGCSRYLNEHYGNLYWNSNQAPNKFLISVKLINECIDVASKYGGRVFGGYVRNVLIPHFYGLKSPGFKDVDLWFTSSSEALKFVLDMGNKLIYRNNTDQYNNQKGKVVYPFGRSQFMLVDEHNNEVVIIDVITSDTLPVNDLNVNQLTYNTVQSYRSFGKEDTMMLMKLIKEKTATKLPGYSEKEFEKAGMAWGFVQDSRLEKLTQNGWKIDNGEKVLKDNVYWNSNQDDMTFNKSLQEIDDCITVASKYNGRVFGGYVRNILVPKLYNQPLVGFKDVDLWFTNQSDANWFILQMGDKLTVKVYTDQYNNFKDNKVRYPFGRTQFMLLDELKNPVVIIDVIVSEKLPINDLNVNKLTFNTDGWASFSNCSVDTLKQLIRDKETYRLPYYSEKDYKDANMDWLPQKARLEKLERLGWKVY